MTTPEPLTRVWLGAYPADGAGGEPGTGEGIWRLDVDPLRGTVSGVLAMTSPAPSFLAASADGRTLYAAGETAPGTVSCFAVDPDGALSLREQISSGGDHPCHLLVAPDGRTLYVSNYSSGTVGVLPLEADGGFAEAVPATATPVQVLGHEGSGPVEDRQDGPHAHSAVLTPDAAHLLVADLGTDEVRRYRRGADGSLTADGVAVTLPPGTGPRHMVFSADGRHLYLTGELSASVLALAWDVEAAAGTVVQALPVQDEGRPNASGTAEPQPSAGRSPRDLPAHLALTGDRLLVSVREADVLVAFDLDDGLLRRAGEVTSGRWPRHFAVLGDGDLVLVAAERGHEVVSFGRPARVGRHGLPPVEPLVRAAVWHVPSPACVLASVPHV